MIHRNRFRRIASVFAFAATLAVVGIWLASLRWIAAYTLISEQRDRVVATALLSRGVLCISFERRVNDPDYYDQIVVCGLTPRYPAGWHFEGVDEGDPAAVLATFFGGWGRVYGFVWPEWSGIEHASTGHAELDSGTVRLPLWLPAAVACGLLMLLRLRRRRIQPGHCHACGYDLRGNTSGVCPECGTRISTAMLAARSHGPCSG